MPEPAITPLDATFGARITGIALDSLDDNAWHAIEDAFHRHALLVFPGQNITPAAQTAFAARFGAIEEIVAGNKAVPISNKKADGTLMAPGDYGMKIMKGNEGWHTDRSYMSVSAKASCLAAHVVPSEGGQTEWADMRAAYDALDDALRARIEGLSAFHSLMHSQAKIGHQAEAGSSYGMMDGEPPLRPLVKTHPVTGRKSLFVGRHAFGIPGLPEDESERLLSDLVAFACQPPRTYRHDWQPGDVAIWDNRCLLHRARPFDIAEPRVMWHVRISGDPTTERALNRAA